MATRYNEHVKGKKKGKRAKKRGKKKGKKNSAAGHRLVRFNQLRAQGWSKADAKAEIFGGGGGRGKKGKHKKAKHSRKKHKSHRAGGYLHRGNFGKVLAEIQSYEGTSGLPPTAAERQMALNATSYGRPSAMNEKDKFRAKITAEKEALIAEKEALIDQIAAEELRKERAEGEKEARIAARRRAAETLKDL